MKEEVRSIYYDFGPKFYSPSKYSHICGITMCIRFVHVFICGHSKVRRVRRCSQPLKCSDSQNIKTRLDIDCRWCGAARTKPHSLFRPAKRIFLMAKFRMMEVCRC